MRKRKEERRRRCELDLMRKRRTKALAAKSTPPKVKIDQRIGKKETREERREGKRKRQNLREEIRRGQKSD